MSEIKRIGAAAGIELTLDQDTNEYTLKFNANNLVFNIEDEELELARKNFKNVRVAQYSPEAFKSSYCEDGREYEVTYRLNVDIREMCSKAKPKSATPKVSTAQKFDMILNAINVLTSSINEVRSEVGMPVIGAEKPEQIAQ